MAAVSENPVGDPIISAMLDEFEEGTLLSLLEDSDLFSYIQNLPLSPTGDLEDDPTAVEDLDLFELFGHGVLPECLSSRRNSRLGSMDTTSTGPVASSSDREISPNVSQVELDSMTLPPSPTRSGGSDTDVSNLDSNDSDSAEEATISFSPKPTKRRKVEYSSSREQEGVSLRACVEHDHCYTRAVTSSGLLLSAGGKTAPAVEEANLSDAGRLLQ